jgi:hypothetical protein
MAKKRIVESAPATDEWGIYDPAKAGMQALFSRLGRPILRASAASTRRERRRASHPERTADGVGLAIEEAKRRAVLKSAAASAPVVPPLAPQEPATRGAKKKTPRAPVITARAAGKRKSVRSAPHAESTAEQTAAPEVDVATAEPNQPATKPRTKKAGRTREASGPEPSAPAIPPPSPRRPRGAVPLAAWAHAVSDAPRAEPRRSDVRGLWRGIFRIPSDVALVEYGRGCRIHRLVIETPPEAFLDTF